MAHALLQPGLRANVRPFCMSSPSLRAAPACTARQSRVAAAQNDRSQPILIFDVMDTLVWDPFYTEMPEFFDMKLPDLLKQKHPSAWPEFERGEIDEDELYRKFFKDGRNINGAGLMRQMMTGYRFLDGIEELLSDLNQAGVEMHIMSNYPVWYKRIEAKLVLSRFMPWTFVSCEGPMKGIRKPDPKSYSIVSETLGVPPEQIMLIDDRQNNVIGALECGWNAFQYKNTPALRVDLMKRQILNPNPRKQPG